MIRRPSFVALFALVASACGEPEPQSIMKTVTAGQTCGNWSELDGTFVLAECDKYSTCWPVTDFKEGGSVGVCQDDGGSCNIGNPSSMPLCYVHERVAEPGEVICAPWGYGFCLQPCTSHADCTEPFQLCASDGFMRACLVMGCQDDPTRCQEGTLCGPDGVCVEP